MADSRTSIRLELEGAHPRLLFDLTESQKVATGTPYETSTGARVTPLPSGRMERKAWTEPFQALQFLLEWGGGEALSLIAGWLASSLRGKARQIRINGREVEPDPDAILRVLQEAQGGSDRGPSGDSSGPTERK